MEHANPHDTTNEGFGPFVNPSLELAAPAGAAPESETACVSAQAVSNTAGPSMPNYLPPRPGQQSRRVRDLCVDVARVLIVVGVLALATQAAEETAHIRNSRGVSA